MIHIQFFTFNSYQENTYVLSDESGGSVIVDPGCSNQAERDALTNYIRDQNLNPIELLNTHAHLDHILGNRFVCETYDIDIALHDLDLPNLAAGPRTAIMLGAGEYQLSPIPKRSLTDGMIVEFGTSRLEVRFTPGHSPGHVIFVCHEQKFVMNGDVLFKGSIGRTDLLGGDFDTLADSIRTKLYPLGDNFHVYCGHGPPTTIGCERANNPFVRD